MLKNKDKIKKNISDMYERETNLLNKIKTNLTKNNLSDDLLNYELSSLVKSYEKLLKLTKKLTKVGDANQRKLLLAYDEIDKQKKQLDTAYEKLNKLSRIDPLTGLSNRRDFLEKVNNEKIRYERDKKNFSLILSDIDNFKSFNDKYGHDCGDFVLTKVSEIFTKTVRRQDSVGRWGGEEFILLLPNSSKEGAIMTAEKLRKAISSNTYKYNDLYLSITMTFGVSIFSDSCSINECIKLSDEALYRGKKRGKNCVVYIDG